MPFSSTYDRIAGGTSHWLGTCLRFVPNDFKMKSLYGRSEASFVDWPIGYEDLVDWYGKAEAELGVSADIEDQKYLGIHFPDGYQYPMPPIPDSLTDRAVRKALKNLDAAETEFLGMAEAADRNPGSQCAGRAQFAAIPGSTRLRRQHQLHSDLPDPGQVRSDDYLE